MKGDVTMTFTVVNPERLPHVRQVITEFLYEKYLEKEKQAKLQQIESRKDKSNNK